MELLICVKVKYELFRLKIWKWLFKYNNDLMIYDDILIFMFLFLLYLC